MAVLAFLASVLYWPGVAGAATTPRWALLALVLPWLVRRQTWTVTHAFGAALLGWAVLSLLWTPDRFDGIGTLFILGMLALLFCVGVQSRDLRPVWTGAGLGIAISGILAALHLCGFDLVRGYGPSGLFVNPLFLGEAAALVLVAAVSERMWWLAGLMGPTLAMSGARGAMIAAATAVFVLARQKSLLLAVVLIPIGVIVAIAGVTEFKGEHFWRLDIWQSALNGITPFGHGLGSFWSTYPTFEVRLHPPERPEFAHNELLQVAFELGIPGLLLFLALCCSLAGPIDTARLVLIALAVESAFGFPIHTPTSAFIGLLAAGHAVRGRYLLRDVFAARRRTEPEGLAGA